MAIKDKTKATVARIKAEYAGSKFVNKSYIKPKWDDVYVSGRSGENPMEYDYSRTIRINYNWRGLAMGERDWNG